MESPVLCGQSGRCDMGSGGSSSGTIEYPVYMQEIHSLWLRGQDQHTTADKRRTDPWRDVNYNPRNLHTILLECLEEPNPYDEYVVVDPTEYLISMNTVKNLFYDRLVALGTPQAEVESYLDKAAAKASDLYGDEYIDAVIEEYTLARESLVQRALGQLAVQASASFAEETSGFSIGSSLIERDHLRELSAFAADLKMKLSAERRQMSITLAQTMLTERNTRFDMERLASEAERGYQLTAIAAEIDARTQETGRQTNKLMHRFEIFQEAAAVLSEISGSMPHNVREKRDSSTASRLLGAGAGGVGGAALGLGAGLNFGGSIAAGTTGLAAIPGLGWAAVGAGALLGALSN